MGGKSDSVMERVIEYCRRVDREFKLKRVILFGSRSRGDFYPQSDIDLLLISDEFPDDWFARQTRLYFLKLRQIEPIGYTTDEIQRMKDQGNTFIENILREGKEIKSVPHHGFQQLSLHNLHKDESC
ncbi:MAG: nucleotidyltransferase domain-containing protein [Methanosarcinales archaeon]|nr:nucleotidyltransferase domain-containing protein [Methanosarcinales archaeon]MCK4652349.1 nucleotidyltransferase domain-containing protein [Methanosarcinales archaeon]MCK4811738.1 nucleotidyltransferase domain-containing protein [Methanosarcinales archaeon]